MPKVNLGQVFTPNIIADFMVELFNGDKNAAVLEPCFGKGVFVESLLRHGFTNIFANELDSILFNARSKTPNVSYSNRDFLSLDDKTKYRLVIMNPPYVRQEEINNLDIFGITKQKLRKEEIYKDLPAKANLYCYFILKALSLLDDTGQLIAIFPSTWTTKDSFLNTAISNAGFTINSQFNCVGLPFGNDVLVDVDIVIISRDCTKKSKQKISYINGSLVKEEGFEQTIGINDNHCKLSLIARVKRGFSSGYNDFFFRDIEGHDFETVPCLSNPRACKSFATTNKSFNKCLIVKQKEINKELMDYIHEHEKIVLETKEPTVVYRNICNGEKWYLFNPTKERAGTIVFSYIVRDKMRFVLLHKNALVRDNFYTIVSDIDSYLLFALLNNYYSYSRLELVGKKYGAGLLKLQKYDVGGLNVLNPKIISQEDKDSLIDISKQIINQTISVENFYDSVSLVLAKYEVMSFEDIKNTYFQLKNERLKAYEK